MEDGAVPEETVDVHRLLPAVDPLDVLHLHKPDNQLFLHLLYLRSILDRHPAGLWGWISGDQTLERGVGDNGYQDAQNQQSRCNCTQDGTKSARFELEADFMGGILYDRETISCGKLLLFH